MSSQDQSSSSWVICDRSTGKAVMETFNPKVVSAINTARYEAVPILKYLEGLNQQPDMDGAPGQ